MNGSVYFDPGWAFVSSVYSAAGCLLVFGFGTLGCAVFVRRSNFYQEDIARVAGRFAVFLSMNKFLRTTY